MPVLDTFKTDPLPMYHLGTKTTYLIISPKYGSKDAPTVRLDTGYFGRFKVRQILTKQALAKSTKLNL